MIIAEVVHSFFPMIGGIEDVAYFLSIELVKLGHEVHVFTPKIMSHQRSNETMNGVFIHRLKSIGHFNYIDLCPSLFSNLNKECSEIVHVHSFNQPFCIQAMFASKLLDLPLVATALSVGSKRSHPNFIRRIAGSFLDYSSILSVRCADQIHVKTAYDMDALINAGIEKRKITIIPDGVPDSAFNSPNIEKFLSQYHIKNEKIVLYVGRLHPYKGLQVLLKSSKSVIEHSNKVAFVIIGPKDAFKQKLLSEAKKNGVSDHFVFIENADEQTKTMAYAACDVLVLPSLYDFVEAFSIVVSEGWAQKKPVITTSVGALPSRVRHNVNGLLVPPGDVGDLAQAIIRVLSNPNLARRLGASGHKEVYRWDGVAEEMERLYLKAIREHKCG